VLPPGFHRIRHYGLFANRSRAENLTQARRLLNLPAVLNKTDDADGADDDQPLSHPCPCCGGRMIIIGTFARGGAPRYRRQSAQDR
jgi:hypothetical protein